MALVLSESAAADDPWVSIDCDSPECEAHVTVRPVTPDCSLGELMDVVIDWACDDGWLLGPPWVAWCPSHRFAAPGRHGPS